MTNVTVVFEYEEPEYCRLCLVEASDDNELSSIVDSCISNEDDITQIIRTLLQIELDPSKDANSCICSTCLESLEEFYRYRSQCRQHNVTLQKKAIDRKKKQIELAKHAIENTDVLDQVTNGEPIKVIIRMNSEGKASVGVQVQSKAQDSANKFDGTKVSAGIGTQPQSASTDQSLSTAVSTRLEDPQKVVHIKKQSEKLIRLPLHQFYFYQTTNNGFGLIYGGYRYYSSIPRKSRTYWVCEQRNTHNCQTLLLADKAYVVFHLNWGHNHDPPKVCDNLIIFKPCDVLHKVIQRDRIWEQELIKRKTQIKESEMSAELESDDKDESSGTEDEDPQDEIAEICGEDSDGVQPIAIEIKKDPDFNELSQSSSSSQVQIDAGENMYIIQELT
ncbi:uncharacterized protein LOC131433667 [Malaya genurostris]|uniref:uncharacterized protein LOC131433667 n=1 Tax=Malaya genurostris TaxID=325434 RepID=UPI0026F3C4F6|nr:uncharacterized protein LOC131433667 [Malaya genurostris]